MGMDSRKYSADLKVEAVHLVTSSGEGSVALTANRTPPAAFEIIPWWPNAAHGSISPGNLTRRTTEGAGVASMQQCQTGQHCAL